MSEFETLADDGFRIAADTKFCCSRFSISSSSIPTLTQKSNEQCFMSLNSDTVKNDLSLCDLQYVKPNLILESQKFKIGSHSYGKNSVKLLLLKRGDSRHEIGEFEVDVQLRLSTQKDYLYGDNRDIVATDSQKNTVYLLAKKHGLKTPEEFGVLLCSHFLSQYKHVEEVNVKIKKYPWLRHEVNGEPHNHAFVFSHTATRFCRVNQIRNEPPKVQGGLKDLRILKTTQSSFKGFIRDEFTTLPETDDRIFSTVVTATWDFSTIIGVDFDKVWHTVRDCILENFAGPAKTGIYSPSVQNTLYMSEKAVLTKVHQISSIEMQMPNKHYFEYDLSKFSSIVSEENKEVYLPVNEPSGIICAQLDR